ncbi:MAG TPA: hypothetical protein VF395_12095 [Polyangiaceae bacterium]
MNLESVKLKVEDHQVRVQRWTKELGVTPFTFDFFSMRGSESWLRFHPFSNYRGL